MTESSSTASLHLAGVEEPEHEYRSIHWAAIVALLLGFASALALISPLLAIVPVAAVMVAAYAIRTIRTSPDQWIGLTPAMIGLALATFFFGYGVSSGLVRSQRIEGQARQFTRDWLQLIDQGKLQEAHQWLFSASSRATPSQSLDKYYNMEPERMSLLQRFSQETMVAALKREATADDVQFEEIVKHTSNGPDHHVTFRLAIPDASQPRGRLEVWLEVAWYIDEILGERHWQVRTIDYTPPMS